MTTGARCLRSQTLWRVCVLRGDIHEFRPPRGTGHEQRGRRYGVIVQADELLPRSVVLVAPTSLSARPASFRPEIELLDQTTVRLEHRGYSPVLRKASLPPATHIPDGATGPCATSSLDLAPNRLRGN